MEPMPLNVGNTAFMLLCASLVMLMTPGLAFFYGGLVGRKNVLTIMTQSFVSLGWTTVLWFAFGYSMCFGPTWHGIVGDPTYYAFLKGITLHTMYTGNDAGIPLIVHVSYQMMFAIITPALITGAFANRVTFKAYFLFLTGWLVFVYFPFVHMVWNPDGILAKWGVLDFAGGIVVHNTAGFAALASILYVGRRNVVENIPHNVPLIALGTGLLWFGWYGFNAGSELRVDQITASAFLNTDIAASFAGATWLLVEWMNAKQPKFVGLLTGCRRRPGHHHARRGLCVPQHRRAHRHPGRRDLLLRRGPEEQAGLGRCAGCLGRARRGRAHRRGLPGHLRVQGLEPGRIRWPVAGQRGLLRQAVRGGGDLLRLGLLLHLRHALDHRPHYPGPRGGQHGGEGTRYRIAGRRSLSPRSLNHLVHSSGKHEFRPHGHELICGGLCHSPDLGLGWGWSAKKGRLNSAALELRARLGH